MTNSQIKAKLGYLTTEGEYWLKVDLANTMGFDKLTFSERVLKAEQVLTQLDNQDTIDRLYNSGTLDDKYAFLNNIQAWRDHKAGKHVEHMMYLDATNSGLQMYSVLASDATTGMLCNMSSGSELTDAYTMLADALNLSSGTTLFNRRNCKKALMITLYASTQGGSTILEYMSQDEVAQIPLNFDITEEFELAMQSIAPNAMELMHTIQQAHTDTNAESYSWTLPDGFKVHYAVKVDKAVASSIGDVTLLQVSESNGVNVSSRALSPNIIHSIDAYVVREVVRRMSDAVQPIHDAFAVHPNFIGELKAHYTAILSELNDSDILNSILAEVTGKPSNIAKANTLTGALISSSIYNLS